MGPAGVAGDRPGDRGGEHDASVPALAHARQHRLDHEEHALDVDGEDAVPVGLGHVRDARLRVDAGVADEHVDAAVPLEHAAHGRLARSLARDVDRDELDGGAGAGQLGRRRLAGVLVDVGDVRAWRPRRRRRAAMPRPMPLAAPVMIVTLPCMRSATLVLRCRWRGIRRTRRRCLAGPSRTDEGGGVAAPSSS